MHGWPTRTRLVELTALLWLLLLGIGLRASSGKNIRVDRLVLLVAALLIGLTLKLILWSSVLLLSTSVLLVRVYTPVA